MKRHILWVAVGSVVILGITVSAAERCDDQSAFCFSRSAYKTPVAIKAVETPRVAVPLWRGSE